MNMILHGPFLFRDISEEQANDIKLYGEVVFLEWSLIDWDLAFGLVVLT